MGEPELIVLLYSQYSKDCGHFVDTANKYGINYITPVCIDNSKIREIVKSKIKFVPTLLFIFKDGIVDTYQGEKAMLWLDNAIRPIQERLEQEEEIKRLQQIQSMNSLKRGGRGGRERKDMREIEYEGEEIEEIEEIGEERNERNESKPVVKKQSGFVIIDEEMEIPDKKIDKTSGKLEKKTEQDIKRDELTQKAAMMAQSREIMEKSNNLQKRPKLNA